MGHDNRIIDVLMFLCITRCGNGGRLEHVYCIGGVISWDVVKLFVDGPREAFDAQGWLVVWSALTLSPN
jgi:hypothetical protein